MDKRKIIALLAILVVIVVVVVAILLKRDSDVGNKSEDKNQTQTEQTTEKDDAQEKNDDKEEVYNGDGLEVKEEATSTTINRVDGSGSWDESDDTDTGVVDKESSSDTNADKGDNGVSNEDVLNDEKEWSDIR